VESASESLTLGKIFRTGEVKKGPVRNLYPVEIWGGRGTKKIRRKTWRKRKTFIKYFSTRETTSEEKEGNVVQKRDLGEWRRAF